MSQSHRRGVYGVLGHGISHSLSPGIFRLVFAALRWPAVYALCDLPPRRLGRFLRACTDAGVVGLNVTMPYKTQVMDHVDRVDRSATRVGAINTIAVRGHSLIGYNTDVDGVVAALTPHRAALRGGSAIVFGAGGAALAVVSALVDSLAMGRVTLVARRPNRARALVDRIRFRAHAPVVDVIKWGRADVRPRLDTAALLVNATPLGSGSGTRDSVLPNNTAIAPSTVVFDLVYRPRLTHLLRQAQRAGCRHVIGGWTMLIAQADASFAIWTGRRFPASVRRRLLNSAELV